MRKLLKTLYILSVDILLSYDNENILIIQNKKVIDRFPLITLEGIVTFSQIAPTVPLMAACARSNIPLTFLSVYGTFLFRLSDTEHGSVLLRKLHYRISENEEVCQSFASIILDAKLKNSHTVLQRGVRETDDAEKKTRLENACEHLSSIRKRMKPNSSVDTLRGLEGVASTYYFDVLDDLVTQQKDSFHFDVRSTRPPKNPFNALLSFGYTLLARECTAALESVGLDSYVGFLHKDRVGRESLALDLMEEFRAPMVDRFVLKLINQKIIQPSHFMKVEEDGVYLNDLGKRLFITHWERRKTESLTHPFLDEKIAWGLVPFAQAQLLVRTMRGEIEKYPAFHWR